MRQHDQRFRDGFEGMSSGVLMSKVYHGGGRDARVRKRAGYKSATLALYQHSAYFFTYPFATFFAAGAILG